MPATYHSTLWRQLKGVPISLPLSQMASAMKNLDTSSGIELFSQKLGHRKGIADAINYLKSNPNYLKQLFSEVELAVDKYNQFKFNPMLINAVHLKTITDTLPGALGIKKIFDSKYLDNFWDLMNEFSFIDEIWKPSDMAAAVTIASYRTWMLTIHPEWKEKKAQVASALEEMLAIEALNGNVTNIFRATKHWLLDWRGEGVSQELAERIENIV